MKKRLILFFFLVGMASLLISCQKKAENKENVTIEFFNQKNEVKDLVDNLIKDFEAENPSITVNHVNVPDSRTVLYSRMASGDTPDVMSIFPDESDFKTQAKENYFRDISKAGFIQRVRPMFLDEARVDGKDYSLPLTLNAYGIYYNVDEFKKLGIAVPTTWNELAEVSKKIKAAGYYPFALSFKAVWTTGHLTEAVLNNLGSQDTINKTFLDTSVKAENNELITRLIEKMDFMAANCQEDAAGQDYADAVNLFASGKALMLPQGIWTVPMIKQAAPDFAYKMFPVPNDDGKGKVTYGIDYAVAVSANSKHPEAAEKFLDFMSSNHAAQYLIDNEKSPSTIQGIVGNTAETDDVTKLLFEDGRAEKWIHFNWQPGQDSAWQSITSSYFIMKNKSDFCQQIDKEFGKK